MADQTPFFIRPYYVKGDEKHILGQKILCHLGILKEGFFFHPTPEELC